jgi:hypothetical protein
MPSPCMQSGMENSSEDCLYLNVFVPGFQQQEQRPIATASAAIMASPRSGQWLLLHQCPGSAFSPISYLTVSTGLRRPPWLRESARHRTRPTCRSVFKRRLTGI